MIPPVKAQMTTCSKNLRGHGPLGPRRHLCLQAKERTWVNCKPSTAWHQNSEPGSSAVWVSYRQINCYCKK